jgi:hypothetical protein
MSRHLENKQDAAFVLETATAAMEKAGARSSDPKQIAAAFLGEIVLAIDALQQKTVDEILAREPSGAPTGKAAQRMEEMLAKGRVPRTGQRILDALAGGPSGAPTGKAAQRILDTTGTGKGRLSKEDLEKLAKDGISMTSAGAKGQPLHVAILAAVTQSPEFANSVRKAFESDDVQLTSKGRELLANLMCKELLEMARSNRDSFAAPTAENIKVDLEGMTKPRLEAGNTLS